MMNIRFALLAVLLLAVTLEALGPGVKVAIKQSTITAIKDQILPIIMRQIKDITAPDIEGDLGPIHYKIHDIRAHMNDLPPGNVRITLLTNTNRVAAVVVGINASGHCRIDYKILFISDGFDGNAAIHDVTLTTTIAIGYDGDGRPTANIVQFDIGINAGNVDISFHGSIIGELVNFVANILKPIFVDMVRGMINNTVPGVMNQMLNNLIRTLPLTVDIGPNMAITFKIPQNPWVNADYFCVAISGYIFYKPKPSPPPYDPPACPDYEPNSQKGIHFFLTDYIVRSALDAGFAAGLLNIQYSVSFSGYDLTFDCASVTSPVIAFNNDLKVNLKEKIKDQTLFFEILRLAVAHMEIDNPHKYDLKWFEEGLNFVLAKAAEAINLLLGMRGIKLPSVDGIDYSDIEEYPKAGYIEALVTPVIHLKESVLLAQPNEAA